MNALEIVQQAAATLRFDIPKTIEDYQDGNAQALLAQLNRALEELLKDYDWQALYKHATFVADKSTFYNSALQGYAIKSIAPGFGCFETDYVYNETERKILNSVTLDAYEYSKMHNNGGVIQKFILRYNHICFMPELPTNTRISFWYKTKYPVFNFDASGDLELKQHFTRDSDESDIDDVLLLKGLIWKYKNEFGFDYAEAYRDYEKILSKAKDQDQNRRRVGDGLNKLPGQPYANIPDTGVGL